MELNPQNRVKPFPLELWVELNAKQKKVVARAHFWLGQHYASSEKKARRNIVKMVGRRQAIKSMKILKGY